MTSHALMVEVRLLDSRYHGVGDWPPSPFRLFQALVAGAYGGRWRSESTDGKDAAFRWLEALEPPLIAGPAKKRAAATTYFVPNNDLDAVGGDLRRVSEIRVGKLVRPILFDQDWSFLYAWPFEAGESHAMKVCTLVERLHTLGWGIDAAFAQGQVCSWEEALNRLEHHGGALSTPAGQGNPERDPSSPRPGSLDSLKARHSAVVKRFEQLHDGRSLVTLFHQPPKPIFRSISYTRPPTLFLFDLMSGGSDAKFEAIAHTRAVWLVEQVRDRLAKLLRRHYETLLVDRVVVGRGANEADKATRIRITSLPSIGFPHADRATRRVLIEVPPDCPLPAPEIGRAAAAVHLGMNADGEIVDEALPQLVRAAEESMLDHYGVGKEAFRLWRTVTPAALPEQAARRRIDPARLVERHQQKSAAERAKEESRAAGAVIQALRHAGVTALVESIRVQREPFARKGERAEAFVQGTRFAKERMWHAEIVFGEPVRGPLVIGDGRYLGLGLMAPEKGAWRDVLAFPLAANSNIALADAPDLVHAARRAVMALARDDRGNVPRLFSGHEPDSRPVRGGRHNHIFFAADHGDGDAKIDRLIVATPWACDRTVFGRKDNRARFDQVVSRLATIHAGRLGVIALSRAAALADGDPLIGPARIWESRTSYRPTRHARRRRDPAASLIRDVITECGRRGLPKPEVDILGIVTGPNGGNISANLRLCFAVAVRGPLMLGRDSHKGGGLFAAYV